MSKKIRIGDVGVFSFKVENPYRHTGWQGADRRTALMQFRAGTLPEYCDVWYMPAEGGARRIESSDEVDWRGMSN
jgi:hypothetical protein